MIKRLQKMNFVSAIAFLLSSLCLLFIPFANLTDKLPEYAYVIAAVFWVGLLVGIGLQIYLKSKCKKLKVPISGIGFVMPLHCLLLLFL